jgi:hypothetical protein
MRRPTLVVIMFASLTVGTLSLGSVSSAAPKVPSLEITGLTYVEADVTVQPGVRGLTDAPCPHGDYVVGGGGYEVTQGLGEDLASSSPNSDRSWEASFNNQGSTNDTGVVVATCAPADRLHNYSYQTGDSVIVPANGETQAVATCPSGTVSVAGGGTGSGEQTYDGLDASAPYGTNGWRVYLSAAGPDSQAGNVDVVCATKPTGWAQISSAYKANPADTATNVKVKCPSGTLVLSGGPFNSSSDPEVTIALTTSLSNLDGWHSVENNNSSTDESVDEWAVCAKAERASS